MANYFWFLASGTGNWTSTGGSNRWYSATGGGGTRYTTTVPGPGDNAIFDANSGAGTCNLPPSSTGTCLNLYCNGFGAVGPTTTQISGGAGSVLQVSGDVVLSPNQIFDLKQYPQVSMVGTGAGSITTNGNSFGDLSISKTGATVTLNDDLIGVGNATLNLVSGTLNANNKNVSFGSFYTGGTSTRTLTMGSGTWNMLFEGETTSVPINSWDIASTTGLTFNKDTATIRLNHARNDPTTNNSLVTGLRTALTSGATTIDVVDITGFPTTGLVLIGNEVVQYAGTNTTTRQLTTLTRAYGGTTTLASVPVGTAVTGVMQGNSTLTAAMTSGVAAAISVVDASKFPPSGDLYIGTEIIHYQGTNLTTNQLGTTTVGTPTQNHAINDPVYSYQAKVFNGGGLTYNTVVFGCFGYKTKNTITGSNTFSDIANSNTGFTWTANANKYPGFQELIFSAGATNTVTSSFTFTGTSSYQQAISSSTTSVTNLRVLTNQLDGVYPVGTHSTNTGSTGISLTSGGVVDYINYNYVAVTVLNYTITVTGVSATTALGTVTCGIGYTVTGVSATALLGTVTYNMTYIPTGVYAIGIIGAVTYGAYWEPVDDGQSGAWVPVDDAQTNAWSAVDTTQSPGWTQM